jgi:hypothetical protein
VHRNMNESIQPKREQSVETVLKSFPKQLIWVSTLTYMVIFGGLIALLWNVKIPDKAEINGSLDFQNGKFIFTTSDSIAKQSDFKEGQKITCLLVGVYNNKSEIRGAIKEVLKGNNFLELTFETPTEVINKIGLPYSQAKTANCQMVYIKRERRMIEQVFTHQLAK